MEILFISCKQSFVIFLNLFVKIYWNLLKFIETISWLLLVRNYFDSFQLEGDACKEIFKICSFETSL